jgi:nucleoside 2-deoxyribosyltransferase
VAKIRIYLAGPEVFLPDAAKVIAAKCDLTAAAGFIPVAPGDAKIPTDLPKHERGIAISAYDEQLMDRADAIIANLTPFRGPSADTGTAYELGYMCARGKAAFVYTNDPRNHQQRVVAHYGGTITQAGTDYPRGPDGLAVEDFDMIDNLMLHGGVERRNGAVIVGNASAAQIYTDLTAFRETLAVAAKSLL